MMFIALKTEDGVIKGKISFYCRMLKVTRQGFYNYLANKDRPWKYKDQSDAMRAIVAEDECNKNSYVSGAFVETARRRPHTRRADRLPHHGENRTQPPPKAQTKRDYKG